MDTCSFENMFLQGEILPYWHLSYTTIIFLYLCNMTIHRDKDKYAGSPRPVWQNSKACIFLAALQEGTGLGKEPEANSHYVS